MAEMETLENEEIEMVTQTSLASCLKSSCPTTQ